MGFDVIGQFNIAARVVQAAKDQGVLIATAESCTGGMIAAALTGVAGSSAVFDRGFVTYSYPSKTEMLNVSKKTLNAFGAVSEQVAMEMAAGALQGSDADISIAVTGVAGPGADRDKAEGLVWFGLATVNEVLTRQQHYGPIGRDNVRMATVETGLQWLLDEISSR
ncbi:MAG: CinA family protein [Paracoccaceae bacterium]